MVLWERSAEVWLGFILYLVLFKTSIGFEMNYWVTCHERWNMLHEFSVVFRDRCTFGTETVPGGFKFWGCEGGADKQFQLSQDSSLYVYQILLIWSYATENKKK